MEELDILRNAISALDDIARTPEIPFSAYFTHLKRDLTSHFWSEYMTRRCVKKVMSPAELTSLVSTEDPRYAELSAIVDQILAGYTPAAYATGSRPLIGGIQVWEPDSLTDDNLKAMDSYLEDLLK